MPPVGIEFQIRNIERGERQRRFGQIDRGVGLLPDFIQGGFNCPSCLGFGWRHVAFHCRSFKGSDCTGAGIAALAGVAFVGVAPTGVVFVGVPLVGVSIAAAPV